MTKEEFIKMCKTRDWNGLLDMFPSDISDMDIKIAATAIIGKYHPDADKREKYGLSMWKNLLSAEPTSRMMTMITAAVSLIDFTNAYMILEFAVEDIPAADALKNFVRENKMVLGQILSHHMMPQQSKDQIMHIFGDDMVLNKKQKEAFFAREFENERLHKITKIQAVDRINDVLSAVFKLKQSEFEFSYSEPSSMAGIYSQSPEGVITFTHDIGYEEIKKMADQLNALGVESHAWAGGIKTFVSLQSIDEILSAHQPESSFRPGIN